MVIKTAKGMYKVLKNTKNALDIPAFEDKYIEECFDQYPYIVGDISSGILRIKGFSGNENDKNSYKLIDEYIFDSCSFRCPVFILKRIMTEEEFVKELELNEEPITEDEKQFTLVKENFDKETLVLESTPSTTPNIVIDIARVNSIPKYSLPPDLEAIKKQEEASFIHNQNRRNNNQRNNSQNNNLNNNANNKNGQVRNKAEVNNQKNNQNQTFNKSNNNNQQQNKQNRPNNNKKKKPNPNNRPAQQNVKKEN